MHTHITDHFAWDEAHCKCEHQTETGCIDQHMPVESIVATAERLENLRSLAGGQPLIVNSWHRCPRHPQEAKKPKGALHRHSTGRAVDVYAPDKLRRIELVTLAAGAGFRSIGWYKWGLHLDWCDGDILRHWIGD